MQTPNDPLESLLLQWQGERPPAHQPLSREVWRRIADAENPAAKSGFWSQIEVVFSRPSFAAAFIAACILGGLFLAEARLSRLQADRNTRLEQSYVELVDPLLRYNTRPQTTSVSR